MSSIHWLVDGVAGEPVSSESAALHPDAGLLDAYSRAVVSAVQKVSPAVVHIQVRQNVRGRETQGAGSGFLFTPDGFILTNSHVVHGASEVFITTEAGDRCPVEAVGDDPDTDLVVVRGNISTASVPLGSSRNLAVGQLVVAIGNPLGRNPARTSFSARRAAAGSVFGLSPGCRRRTYRTSGGCGSGWCRGTATGSPRLRTRER
jgi:S1-C subfamily serine protease